jgi:flagellar biosynthesis/type III secretory pathway M-ring protein FliF/YscJ
MTDIALSLMMLTALAMVGGAYALHRRGEPRRKIVLMLVLAAVIAVNIAILTWPGPAGKAPLSQGAAPS